jgi:hypothetical protein
VHEDLMFFMQRHAAHALGGAINLCSSSYPCTTKARAYKGPCRLLGLARLQCFGQDQEARRNDTPERPDGETHPEEPG